MKIQIKTVWDLEEMAKKPFDEHTTVISVTGGMDTWQDSEYKPQNALILDHEGIFPIDEDDEDYDPFSEEMLFPPEEAKAIVEFLEQHLDETDVLICQSVPYHDQALAIAVAAAVEDQLLHDDGKLFMKNGCYHGYNEVYKMLKDAFAGSLSELAVIVKAPDDWIDSLDVEEVDTDETVRSKSRD